MQELAKQVRSDTLQILNAAHPSWLTFAPDGMSNHILWHAGHALWLQDRLCIHIADWPRRVARWLGDPIRNELPTGRPDSRLAWP